MRKKTTDSATLSLLQYVFEQAGLEKVFLCMSPECTVDGALVSHVPTQHQIAVRRESNARVPARAHSTNIDRVVTVLDVAATLETTRRDTREPARGKI